MILRIGALRWGSAQDLLRQTTREEIAMAKEAEYRPKGSNVRIRVGKRGGKQFEHTSKTKKGTKKSTYHYAPKKR